MDRDVLILRRRAALTEAKAIQKYLDGKITEDHLMVELERANSQRPHRQGRETDPPFTDLLPAFGQVQKH